MIPCLEDDSKMTGVTLQAKVAYRGGLYSSLRQFPLRRVE